MLSHAKGYIIAATVQALVTGAYFVSFLLCLRWLVFSDNGGTLRKRIDWPYLIIAIILFVFSLTDLIISLQAALFSAEGRSAKVYTNVITVRNLTI